MSWKSVDAAGLAAVLFVLATIAKADDQQLVENYLKSRGASTGAVVRPITDDYVGRAFPDFSFFGVIFRQYPVAVLCPHMQDLKCSNVFFVKDGQVDFVSNSEDLKFFFASELRPVPSQAAATDAASTWLRFSEELKQDLFYTFSAPEISYVPEKDITFVRGHTTVRAGGQGHIDRLMTLGTVGGLLNIYERSALLPGVRPICQATKLLDRVRSCDAWRNRTSWSWVVGRNRTWTKFELQLSPSSGRLSTKSGNGFSAKVARSKSQFTRTPYLGNGRLHGCQTDHVQTPLLLTG